MQIGKYKLDSEQLKIVKNNDQFLLVVAGAGSGKTLTILGKINYLVNNLKIDKNDILCISFTKASATSLKDKITKDLNLNIDVYTFHKLGLEIIKENNLKYKITDEDTLENIIDSFIYSDVLDNKKFMKYLLKILNIKYKNKEQYIKVVNDYKNIYTLRQTIITFINLFKCNGYETKDFNKLLQKIKLNIFKYRYNKLFLIIIINIYLKYEKYLKDNNEIDFNDMIIEATNIVKEKGIKKRYKYIIIDEYQDTSFIRFKLIKEIISKTNASLMVVGDDFQSIYKFTGCDLNIFLNFSKYFKNSKLLKIESTYRNSIQLIKVAGSFVMKNKKQIKKNLKSNKYFDKPIHIIYYNNIQSCFIKLIQEIYKQYHNSIMVLGRYNSDINKVINKEFVLENNKLIYIKNKNIDITYLTVHKSKGLESDNVIIINMEDGLLGFPSKIKDPNILKLISIKEDKMKFAEERRLFYVALTRTKNKVFLLVSKKNESPFVKELTHNYKKNIIITK